MDKISYITIDFYNAKQLIAFFKILFMILLEYVFNIKYTHKVPIQVSTLIDKVAKMLIWDPLSQIPVQELRVLLLQYHQ